jgi:hypothetical protein
LTKVRQSLLDSNLTLRWCASDGVVTKFWVDNAVTTIRNTALVRDADQPVVLRRSDFGQEEIRVTGDFTAYSTINLVKIGGSASVAEKAAKAGVNLDIEWTPGKIGDHYQIQLHANGVIEGQVISG